MQVTYRKPSFGDPVTASVITRASLTGHGGVGSWQVGTHEGRLEGATGTGAGHSTVQRSRSATLNGGGDGGKRRRGRMLISIRSHAYNLW